MTIIRIVILICKKVAIISVVVYQRSERLTIVLETKQSFGS